MKGNSNSFRGLGKICLYVEYFWMSGNAFPKFSEKECVEGKQNLINRSGTKEKKKHLLCTFARFQYLSSFRKPSGRSGNPKFLINLLMYSYIHAYSI